MMKTYLELDEVERDHLLALVTHDVHEARRFLAFYPDEGGPEHPHEAEEARDDLRLSETIADRLADRSHTFRLRGLVDRDRLRVEVREYGDGRVTVWWTDGPRTDEYDVVDVETGLREIGQEAEDAHG